MTISNADVNAKVGVATALAIAGTIAGIAAYLLDVHTEAKENFVLWSLITAAGGFYVSSIVAFVKALSLRGRPVGAGIGFGALALFVFIHYAVGVVSTIVAVGLNDSADELGGFVFVGLIFALINAFGGLVGGAVFCMLVYLTLTEKGWNALASFLGAGVAGLVEGALCYMAQFIFGGILLQNM